MLPQLLLHVALIGRVVVPYNAFLPINLIAIPFVILFFYPAEQTISQKIQIVTYAQINSRGFGVLGFWGFGVPGALDGAKL